MPRVNHVKRAQQRYATIPVLDEETGEQKQVPVINKRTGEQKKSKSGRPVFLRLTQRDTSKPLPMPTCDYCRKEIAVGTPYKWIEPHGRGVRNRHADCPTWNVWEYSDSLSARVAQIQGTNSVPDDLESVEDAETWAQDVGGQVRELAEEKREAADNMEAGFGHETEQSAELADIADQLESWADALENVDIPELPEPEEQECETCQGTGEVDGYQEPEREKCTACDGSGKVTPDEPTDEQMDAWRDAAQEALQTAFEECSL